MNNFKVVITNDLSKVRADVTVAAKGGTILELTKNACVGGSISIPDLICDKELDECEKLKAGGVCKNQCVKPITIGIDHYDLNVLGGIMRVLCKKKPTTEPLWKMIDYVTRFGPHRINEVYAELVAKHGWYTAVESEKWYYAIKHGQLNSDGLAPTKRVKDCTRFILDEIEILNVILDGNAPACVDAGKKLRSIANLNMKSIVGTIEDIVVIRASDSPHEFFHDYNGVHYPILVGYDTQTNWVLISSDGSLRDINCINIMEQKFGCATGNDQVAVNRSSENRLGTAWLLALDIVDKLNA